MGMEISTSLFITCKDEEQLKTISDYLKKSKKYKETILTDCFNCIETEPFVMEHLNLKKINQTTFSIDLWLDEEDYSPQSLALIKCLMKEQISSVIYYERSEDIAHTLHCSRKIKNYQFIVKKMNYGVKNQKMA